MVYLNYKFKIPDHFRENYKGIFAINMLPDILCKRFFAKSLRPM